ncbi:transmembrane protein-like protein 2 [Sarcoptes scabiei]|uniref:Transmembrane protein-like protein 2 n=1 Tax=Sarcoptes scabiei TaxID=52283 RepID=A0A131ZZ45_SARSC|nr:transmembrane protein-like protein 2 [Sarcoptes scabiei]
MKRFSNPLNQIDWSRRSTQSFDTVRLILQILFTNPKFVICFLFNQLGSVFFNLSLAYNPLTTTVPISNTLNFAVIALFGCFYEGVSLNKGNRIPYLVGDSNFDSSTNRTYVYPRSAF